MVDYDSSPGRGVGPNRRCFIVAEASVYRGGSLETSLNRAVLLPIHEGRIDIGRQSDEHQTSRYAKDQKLHL